MCGRYTLITPAADIARSFGVALAESAPRYNIAPTQPVLVIRGIPHEAATLSWGLVPAWSQGPASAKPLINARAETAAEKPSFRDAFKRRRCVIPADGFYEWRSPQEPVRFTTGGLFAFAGLWERWESAEGDVVESCTILTVAANALVAPVHERMPAMLEIEAIDAWLDPARDPRGELLRPYPPERMQATPANPRVNAVAHDGPDVLTPEPPLQPKLPGF